MKQAAAISRRQFLTGAFRERDAGSGETGATSAPPRDLAPEKWVEHYCFSWNEEPQIPDWEDGIDGVLEEMENLKGIEDF